MNPFYYHIFQKLPNHMMTYGYILIQVSCNTPNYENSICAKQRDRVYSLLLSKGQMNVLNKYLISMNTDTVQRNRFYKISIIALLTSERVTGGLRRVAIYISRRNLKCLLNLCVIISKVKISEIGWATRIVQCQSTNFWSPLIHVRLR